MLANLNGVPLIYYVYKKCLETGYNTYVITDSHKIAARFPENAVIISKQEHENGTSRCIEVIDKVLQFDRYINVQGDMPDITPEIIRSVEQELQRSDVSTAYTPMDFNLRNDPNSVKVIHNRGRAHWFCRASLMYGDHHLGVYGYNREAKTMYNTSTKFPEEDIENLEQLRWIQNGIKLGVVEVDFDGIEINTSEDLKRWHEKNGK
jgi:3-deoxy-manno-octulosonate cytidylyltransferase (CMP-KDO synthetase)